ncbi:MAG: MarR family transcriptional regulator [Saprospirales bacterium]|nr:MarR family transcriptional regulator [Saprospirales bacterium]MBK8923343.1 MarR family transcriptional regulator [Saprospirales bacterium]
MRLEDEIKASKFMDEVHKAQLNILFSAAWLRARISATLKPFGLTLEQFNVLRIIRGQREKLVPVKDISSRTIERSSNTTRIIDRLERKGLVERRPSARDGRERPVALRPAGLDLLEKIDSCWQKNNPHSAPWTSEDAETVNRLLDKMRG